MSQFCTPTRHRSTTRGCNVQRGRRLSQAERLLISVHHTFRGRHSKFKDVAIAILVDVLEKYISNNKSGRRKVLSVCCVCFYMCVMYYSVYHWHPKCMFSPRQIYASCCFADSSNICMLFPSLPLPETHRAYNIVSNNHSGGV